MLVIKTKSFRKKKSGQGLVEFALVLPLLLMLVLGIIEFGRLLFVYAAVNTASREAARYGSAAGDNGSGTLRYADCGGMIAAAQRVGILANITGINISYDSGPGTPTVYASCPPGKIEGGKHRVVVSISASYHPLVPLPNIGNLTFNAKSARTILSSVEVGRFPPNPAHIADLDGIASPNGSKWNAVVSILVNDEEGMPVGNATVAGEWGWGHPSSESCVTGPGGWCTLSRIDIPGGKSSITFTVLDIIHAEKAYDPSTNSDPDGDSNPPGTEIIIMKP